MDKTLNAPSVLYYRPGNLGVDDRISFSPESLLGGLDVFTLELNGPAELRAELAAIHDPRLYDLLQPVPRLLREARMLGVQLRIYISLEESGELKLKLAYGADDLLVALEKKNGADYDRSILDRVLKLGSLASTFADQLKAEGERRYGKLLPDLATESDLTVESADYEAALSEALGWIRPEGSKLFLLRTDYRYENPAVEQGGYIHSEYQIGLFSSEELEGYLGRLDGLQRAVVANSVTLAAEGIQPGRKVEQYFSEL